MATNVIMPALEMAQESGVLVAWLKHDGEAVSKGEPIMEIETDKVTVEIEAPASGTLGGVLAKEGDVVPVGQTIAWILAPGEQAPESVPGITQSGRGSSGALPGGGRQPVTQPDHPIEASPVARRMAEEHGLDLALLKSDGRRIEKADVLAYLADPRAGAPESGPIPSGHSTSRLVPASPKARRLASERGIDIATILGSGPEGAVLAADVPLQATAENPEAQVETPGTVWRLMAEHMVSSWSSVPHFYLVREVDASQLMDWRESVAAAVEGKTGAKPTYTDLLVRLIGAALHEHPRMNAAWVNGRIELYKNIDVGLAVAVEEGLLVPVIRNAERASLSEITAQRKDLVERAQSRKLRPADVSYPTFTLSNLGMYNVDAFQAIVNAPQAAILAVGRIAERVVPVKGQVAIRPMMIMSLSCDHRVVDGVRAAQFLDALADKIEHPLALLS